MSSNVIKNIDKKIEKQDLKYQEYYAKAEKVKDTIPNLKGMSGMDAVALLGNLGIKVKIKGIGKVKNQSIPAGEKFSKNTTILLELS